MPRLDKPYNRAIRLIILGMWSVVVHQVPNPLTESLKRFRSALSDGERSGSTMSENASGDRGIMGMKTSSTNPAGCVLWSRQGRAAGYGVSARPTQWSSESMWWTETKSLEGGKQLGDKSGQDGYYLMTDEWFDEYN